MFRDSFSSRNTPYTSRYDYRRPQPKTVKKPKTVFLEKYRYVKKTIDVERTRQVQQAPLKRTVRYKKYQFYSFYHRHVCTMIKQLNRYGVEGLLNPQPDSENAQNLIRQQAGASTFNFKSTYKPDGTVEGAYPIEGFDFAYDTPYGVYNWEVFFHAPLMIADRLTQNQKFEQAQKWLHYIFDPTVSEGEIPKRYWKVKPFYEYGEQNTVEDVLKKMGSGDEDFNRQLNRWMKNPFQPHAIARLRTVSYMKAVTMKYLDNLIAWGDNLFRRDTIESINEATQLYIMAEQILGPKPTVVTKKGLAPKTIEDLLGNEDGFAGALVEMESEMGDVETGDEGDAAEGLNSLNSILFFCTSPNDKLLSYWDTVQDRLFKIRHCMNIDGVTRSLALFQPPIDPGLLVKAAASGLDLGAVLNSISGTSLPNYRFRFLVQKALDLCNDVKTLGGSLLNALEKKDAEELSLLRANQEVALLKSVTAIKEQNIEEATENVASLEASLELAEIRKKYYSSREYINKHEQEQLTKMDKAMGYQSKANNTTILSAVVAAIPRLNIGFSGAFGSPVGTTDIVDGMRLNGALQTVAQGLNFLASVESHGATKAGIKGGYDRRKEDWELQTELAEKEMEQVSKQIAAANIRMAVAENDLKNHELQVEQSEGIAAVMEDKFTNKQLYSWMVSQISSLYFQSYQLAYDVARMAEQAYSYELGTEGNYFIQFGHWDSLKKGLLAGERLQADIRRMEIAYVEHNKREFELTKHISLSMLSPGQLVRLREEGICDIQIPEVFFDLDHPGQYMRRIKSVSLTIPCVTGPYTNVNAKLILLSSRTRKNRNMGSGYAYSGTEDLRFNHDVGGIQSIATSSGQNDSGLFELNFNDERYLPFEGAGAISTWRLELSGDYRQFDYDTIADVILHMNYTAREGGEVMRSAANDVIKTGLNLFADELAQSDTGLPQAFSLKTQFPNQLHQLLQSIDGEVYQESSLELSAKHFPHFLQGKTLSLLGDMTVMLKLKDSSEVVATDITFTLTGQNAGQAGTGALTIAPEAAPLPYIHLSNAVGSPIDTWTLRADATDLATKLNTDEVEDIYLVMNYTID
ncbi:Tc toxin subunit A-related protein [Reichenbachiella sp.]